MARLTSGLSLWQDGPCLQHSPMPKTISPSARFTLILEHCPPGQYSLKEVATMTGIPYGALQHLFNNHTHRRVSSPLGIRGRASRRVIIKPPSKEWQTYGSKVYCDHKVVVIPPNNPWPSDLTASMNPGTQPPRGS